MTNNLKRDIMQVGEQMGLRELQYAGTLALAGDYDDLILAMSLVGIEPDEFSMDRGVGDEHIIY